MLKFQDWFSAPANLLQVLRQLLCDQRLKIIPWQDMLSLTINLSDTLYNGIYAQYSVCGGLSIGVKDSTPRVPRFVTVNVPPFR